MRCFLFSLILVLLPCESFAGEFLTYTSYTGGGKPFAFASGDFAGNGRSDLAVLNGTDNVSVFLANSDATLQKPVQYPIGINPTSIAIADINGDGKLDIVVGNDGNPKISQFGDVGILLGNGNGTFRKAIHVNVGSIFPSRIVVADFNSDGKPDIALISKIGGPTLRIFIGNGDGTFRTGATYSIASGFVSFLVADFNQDGKPDLAILNEEICKTCNTVTVLLGNGDGTFQAGLVTPSLKATAMVVGDFNGDGRLDLLVGSGYFLAGNGDGTFAAPVFAGFFFEFAAAVGDLNGDGKLDLVANSQLGSNTTKQSAYSTITVLGNGDGTFQAPITYDVGPLAVAVGAVDLSGNGKLDAVTMNTDAGIGVALGNGDGTLQAARWTNIVDGYSKGGPFPVVAADFNNDGKADITTLGLDDRGFINAYAFLENGDGTFDSAPSGNCLAAGSRTAGALRSADFNHDHHLDLAVGDASNNSVVICLGNGDGTFQSAMNFFAGGAREMDLADFNGDGNLDLAVPTGGLINILHGNGDGTFQSPVNQGQGTHATYVVAGDFNGDGKVDLVVEGNFTYILLGKGDGTFQTARKVAAAGTSVRIGDFNRDGKLDLAIFTNTTVNILLGNGNGTFQSGKTYGSGFSGQWTVRDFNHDGNLDILGITATGFGILLGNGDGTFKPQANYPVSFASYLAAADFNRDGKLDLVINSTSGTIVVLNTGGAPIAPLTR
jgi:hypothetical protein